MGAGTRPSGSESHLGDLNDERVKPTRRDRLQLHDIALDPPGHGHDLANPASFRTWRELAAGQDIWQPIKARWVCCSSHFLTKTDSWSSGGSWTPYWVAAALVIWRTRGRLGLDRLNTRRGQPATWGRQTPATSRARTQRLARATLPAGPRDVEATPPPRPGLRLARRLPVVRVCPRWAPPLRMRRMPWPW